MASKTKRGGSRSSGNPAGGSAGSSGGAAGGRRTTSADERRAKAAAAREAVAAKERRRRNLIIGGVVVAVLLLVAVVGFFVQNSREDATPVVLPATATGAGDSIVVGRASAPVTVEMYEDFQCPACEALEKQTGPTISTLLDEGRIKINYHMMIFLGPESKRAANAAAAAANEGKFREMHEILYANQPEEHTGGFTNETLLNLGAKIGLTSQAFTDAVNNGTYNGYATKIDDDASKDGVTGTPTVLINGKKLTADQLTPQGFTAAVNAAA